MIKKKSAQDIQDDIFRKMSADRKMEIGTQLWLLAKELDTHKIDYGKQRSTLSSRRSKWDFKKTQHYLRQIKNPIA